MMKSKREPRNRKCESFIGKRARFCIGFLGLMLIGVFPVYAGQVELGGFDISVGSGTLTPASPTPTSTQWKKPTEREPIATVPIQESRETPVSTPTSTPVRELLPKLTAAPGQELSPGLTASPIQKDVSDPSNSPGADGQGSVKGSLSPAPEERPTVLAELSVVPMSSAAATPSAVLIKAPPLPEKREIKKAASVTSGRAEKEAGGEIEEKSGALAKDCKLYGPVKKELFHSLLWEHTMRFVPAIQVKSPGSAGVLSFNINGCEATFSWNGDWLVPKKYTLLFGMNRVRLYLLDEGKNLWKMREWKFFVKSL